METFFFLCNHNIGSFQINSLPELHFPVTCNSDRSQTRVTDNDWNVCTCVSRCWDHLNIIINLVGNSLNTWIVIKLYFTIKWIEIEFIYQLTAVLHGGIHWCIHTFISTYNVHVRVRSCISFWGGQFKVKNYNYSKTF